MLGHVTNEIKFTFKTDWAREVFMEKFGCDVRVTSDGDILMSRGNEFPDAVTIEKYMNSRFVVLTRDWEMSYYHG